MGSQRVGQDCQNFIFTFWEIVGFPGGSDGKEFTFNAGDPNVMPESGRSSGERNSNSLQWSCLENSMDRGAWETTVHGVEKNQT